MKAMPPKSRALFTPFFLLVTAFYLLPLLLKNTGASMIMLLVIFPAVCVVAASLVAWRSGFTWWWPLLAGLLFLPTIWIYYNSSAWVYTVAYGLVSLLGLGASVLMKKVE